MAQHFRVLFTTAEEETEQHDGVLKCASKRQRFVAAFPSYMAFTFVSCNKSEIASFVHTDLMFSPSATWHGSSGAEGLQSLGGRLSRVISKAHPYSKSVSIARVHIDVLLSQKKK